MREVPIKNIHLGYLTIFPNHILKANYVYSEMWGTSDYEFEDIFDAEAYFL